MAVISMLVPAEVQALFGDPPVLLNEDVNVYYNLMDRFTKLIEPKDTMEWLWVKDMTDHTWEVRRLRRFKVLFVELRRDQWHHNKQLLAVKWIEEDEESECAQVPVPDSEKDSADLFMDLIDKYKSADQLIASAELRRDRTLREIERRREDLARRLRKASDEIIEGEGAEVTKAAA